MDDLDLTKTCTNNKKDSKVTILTCSLLDAMYPMAHSNPKGPFQKVQIEHQGKYEPNVPFGDHSNDLQRNDIQLIIFLYQIT